MVALGESERIVVERASVSDLKFFEEEIAAHMDRPLSRTGYRLTEVAGMHLPDEIRLSYVVGCEGEQRFVYVVLWRDPLGAEPDIFDVSSEEQAKSEVLGALKELVRRQA